MEALPDFGLPATVETFNGGLKPGFPRRGKDRGNSQAQAEPDHPADAIGGAVIALETGVIVELRVSRQAKITPVLAHSRKDFSGGDVSIGPTCDQTSMKRDGREDIDVNAALNDQVFDDVEAIKLAGSFSYVRKIPSGHGWLPANPATTIQSTAPFENPTDGTHRRYRLNASAKQLLMDGRSAIFTKHTGFPEITANGQHKILKCPIGPLNFVRQRWPIIPVNLAKSLISGAPNPQMNGCDSTTVAPRYFTDGASLANSKDHRSSLNNQRAFLATCNLPGVSFCRTVNYRAIAANCSGGCGTQVFGTLWQLPVQQFKGSTSEPDFVRVQCFKTPRFYSPRRNSFIDATAPFAE
jgi:hypothetical protein